MKFFEEFKIDGSPLLVPDAGVEMTLTDLDGAAAGRDESGVMHRVRVRKRVRSWNFQYFALNREELSYMEELLSRKATFTFTYPDNKGEPAGCKAYCSGTSMTYHSAKLGLYRGYKFSVIEC